MSEKFYLIIYCKKRQCDIYFTYIENNWNLNLIKSGGGTGPMKPSNQTLQKVQVLIPTKPIGFER